MGGAMNIVRWVLLTAAAMAFLLLSVANWTPVPFRLPDGAMVSVPLPLLLAAAFVAGWLPTWLLMVGTRTRLKRKLALYEGKEAKPASIAAPGAP
jgi:putative membrane protein